MLLDRFPRFHARSKRKEQQDNSNSDSKEVTATEEGNGFYENLQHTQPLMFDNSVDNKMMDDDDDMISVDMSVRTPISTPMDMQNQYGGNGLAGAAGIAQPQPLPPLPPYLRLSGRQNTVTSLSSSISDFHAGSNSGSGWNPAMSAGVNESGNFTSSFLRLLMEVYQNICSDPTLTPFDSSSPPSGILNRVSKIAVEESENRGIEIGFERNSRLLTLVRHKLLDEVRKDIYLSRNGSAASIPVLPPHLLDGAAPFEAPSRPDSLRGQSNQDMFNGWSFAAGRSTGNGSLIRTRSNSSQILLNQPGLTRTRSDTNNSGINPGITRQQSIGFSGYQACSGINSPMGPSQTLGMEDHGFLRRRMESIRSQR